MLMTQKERSTHGEVELAAGGGDTRELSTRIVNLQTVRVTSARLDLTLLVQALWRKHPTWSEFLLL